MENDNVEKTFPDAENEVSQVSEAAKVAAGEENKWKNGCGVDEDEGMTVTVARGGGGGEFRPKRKRGRPRKHLGEMRQEFMAHPEFPVSPQKRGRGRPRGSGKWQTLAVALGGNAGDTGGSNFSPHIVTVQEGENIVEKIWTFSQTTAESICIISASGTISSAEIFLPASRGGVVRHEGQFTIVYLNGSHTYAEKGGGKICLLSVQLANPDGRFLGGAVAGSLIAAVPTQLVMATFRQKPSIRPPYLTSPRLNIGRVPTPMQAEKGKLSDGEMRVVATAQRVDGVVINISQSSSAQPVDWTSSQLSTPTRGV